MTFSVILPAHNAAPWIAQSLRSTAEQTHAPHEIIVINDASTDDTNDRILSSGVEVRLVETAFGNAAAARNAGAKIARGDWLAFLDADDYWTPLHLQRAAELLSGTGDVAYTSVHDDLLRDGTHRRAQTPWPWLNTPRSGLTPDDFIRCWTRVMYFSMPSTVVRRDRFEEVGGLDVDQKRRHDSHLWWRIIHGHSWAFDPRPDCVCRIDTPSSVSRTDSAKSAYDAMRALIKTHPLYAAAAGYEQVLANGAYVTMVEAFAYGQSQDRRRAWAISKTYLPPWQRAAFGMAMCAPAAMGAAVRLRRRRSSVDQTELKTHDPPSGVVAIAAPAQTDRRIGQSDPPPAAG